MGFAALVATPQLLADEQSCEEAYSECSDGAHDAYSNCSADCLDKPEHERYACDNGCFDAFTDAEFGCFNAWASCC